MSTKWKILARELYHISRQRSGKNQLESSTIFHVHEVEKFNRRTLLDFMPKKWKVLAGKLYCISCPRSEKL